MRYASAILTRYRYAILTGLFLLVIAEMGLALADLVPIEYEWGLGWILFLTVVTCGTMAIWIGLKAPISHRAMKYAYRILVLVAFLLVILTVIGLRFSSVFPTLDVSSLTLIPMVWLGASGLVVAIAPTNNSVKLYSILLVFPLVVAASIGVLTLTMILGPYVYVAGVLGWLGVSLVIGIVALRTVLSNIPRTDSLYIVVASCALAIPLIIPSLFFAVLVFTSLVISWAFVYVLVFLTLLGAGMVFTPSTVLIITMKYPYRNIVVAGLWLWVMIAGVGWYWAGTMDDGLNAFTSEERAAARSVLYEEHCVNRVNPLYRVAKDDNGSFRVERRTWWRLPIACDMLPEWID